jgi:hypothetical protein
MRQVAAAQRLRERDMGADEVYRQAMLESQKRTRQDARRNALAGIEGRAYDRAAHRFTQMQPRPRDESQQGLSDAQAKAARAQAELALAQAAAVRSGRTKTGGIPGGAPKPDFTPDQAWTNMIQAESEVRATEREIAAINTTKHPDVNWVPDFIEDWTNSGAYSSEPFDVELKDKDGTVYKVIPHAEVQVYRAQAMKDLDYYKSQAAKFREIVRNGNQVSDADKGEDPYEDQFNEDDPPPDGGMSMEEMGDDPNDPGGWESASNVPAGSTIDPDQAGKLAAASPSASGVPTADKGRRPKPPPDILARLPWTDILYYQLADEYPDASDRELKIMRKNIIAMQGRPRGGQPTAPPPNRGTAQ